MMTDAATRRLIMRLRGNGFSRIVPVLYLDIDGTVRQGKDDDLGRFVNTVADVRVFGEAVTMMRRWRSATNGRIAGVSNQGGIALGYVSFDVIAETMIETNRQTGGLFDIISWCSHHPQAAEPELARCWCRKPSPGAIIQAAHGLAENFPGECYPPFLARFVGDRPEDEACAAAAHVDFQWASSWRAQA